MAQYPLLPVFPDESSHEPIKMLAVDEWPSGAARGQDFTSGTRYRFHIVHAALINADFTTLETFYNTNLAIPFEYLDEFANPSVLRTNCIFLPNGFKPHRIDKLYTKVVVDIRMR